MKASVPLSSVPSSKTRHSCVRCFDRKVKCDRQDPCSACVKHNVQCVFRAVKPPRKRQKRVKDGISKNPSERRDPPPERASPQMSLTSPSGQTHGANRSTTTSPNHDLSISTPVPLAAELEGVIVKTQLLRGQERSKFVDNTLWSRVVEEFRDPEDALDDHSDEDVDAEASEDDFSFVIGTTPSSIMTSFHPSVEHAHQLWHIFRENVNPLTKVVHVPTLQLAIEKATSDIDNVPRSLEALMFAIYSTAIMSLKDDECKHRFGESRKTLLSVFISATKTALARAKFMGTTSIVVLQALVLHTISVRDIYDPRTVWTLSGIAVRLSEALGLHRDGTSLGIPPFESEMRRRIWWQLKMNDFRTAELSGLAKFRGLDTDVHSNKLPLNVDDEDLYIGMPSLPAESTKPTDMIFCTIRSKLGSFATHLRARVHRQNLNSYLQDDHPSMNDTIDKGHFIKQLQETFESQYIRYCDPSQPLQLMAMLLARTAIDFGNFMVNHPRSWVKQDHIPDSERQRIWNISIKLLEQYDVVQTSRALQRFSWHAAYFLQWHALIHVLETIRSNPSMPDATKAWQLIDSICENHPDLVTNTRKTINRAVGNLCLNAFNAREAALTKEGKPIPYTPPYITVFRQRREAAKAKSKARNMPIKKNESNLNNEHLPEPSTTQDATRNSNQPPSLSGSNYQHEQSSNPSSYQTPTQQMDASTTIPTDTTDPFAFLDTLDNNHITFLDPSAIQMGPNTVFSFSGQDEMLGNEGGQNVNWTQWDAWLSDSNMAHAGFSTAFGDAPG